MKRRSTIFARRTTGFSLIELLVSMAIGLIVTLAITSVLVRSESSKRSTTSVNDINQTGAYAAYVIDRAVRSAGSGFSQSWNTTYGCLLNAASAGAQVLPASLPASSSFANVTSAAMPIRLAPVVIGKDLANTGSETRGDVLMVMGGTAGAAESPVAVSPVSSTNWQVPNTLVYGVGNVVLLAEAGKPDACMVQQIGSLDASAATVQLAGNYFSATVAGVNLADFGAGTVMAQLGTNITNAPQFTLYGVGANSTLFSYNLLLPAAGNEQPMADGVVEMRAVYGLDTNPPTGVLGSWVDPVAGSGFEASVLMNGSAASQANLRRIIAVRLGLILRTSLPERPQDYQQPTGTALTLFSDLPGMQQTRTLAAAELNYRFRVVETTIPLLNVLNLP